MSLSSAAVAQAAALSSLGLLPPPALAHRSVVIVAAGGRDLVWPQERIASALLQRSGGRPVHLLLLGGTADGAISATGPAMEQPMDRPAGTAMEESRGDALLRPGEIATTSRDDDDRAMGQYRRQQKTGKRQCSGLGHCSRGQAHGLQSKRTGQVVRGFRCRRRWARGLWRSPYSTSTNALSRGQSGCGAMDLRKAKQCADGSES